MFWLYITSFLVALICAFFITPLVRYTALKFKVLDIPTESRRVHKEPIPRWGGLAIFVAFLVSLFFLYLISRRFGMLLAYQHKIYVGDSFSGFLKIGQQLTGIIVAATIVVVLGMIDDKRGIPPVPKLLIQIIAGFVAIDYGVRISGLVLPWNYQFTHFPILLSQIVTIFWLVSFMNTVNFIDGLDGLAAGIVAIAAITFGLVTILQGSTKVVLFSKQLKLASILSFALSGACIGFLVHNFYPAKIFMGDTGSMLLGFLLGTISVIGTLKTTALIALFIPVIVIALPVTDVVLVLFRRYKNGKPLMQADRGHFHHRLLDAGWTQREVVLLMYLITLLLGEATVLLTLYRGMLP